MIQVAPVELVNPEVLAYQGNKALLAIVEPREIGVSKAAQVRQGKPEPLEIKG